MVLNEDSEALVYSGDWRFAAPLKGIVEVEGHITEPFTLVVNMARREPDFDWDLCQYTNYLALHLDHQKAWFSMKKDGTRVDLSSCLLEVATNTSLGLKSEVATTYWLSYDRDNMVVKYGKGYAMEQTTLLICDFSEGAKTDKELASKRDHWNIFFGLYDPARLDTSLLLYRRTRGDSPGMSHLEPIVKIRKEPLIVNPSPFVLDSSKASLNLLEAALYTFSSELPGECRALYDTVFPCQLDSGEDWAPTNLRLSCAIRSDSARPGQASL